MTEINKDKRHGMGRPIVEKLGKRFSFLLTPYKKTMKRQVNINKLGLLFFLNNKSKDFFKDSVKL